MPAATTLSLDALGDLTVLDLEGRPFRLGDRWTEGPVVLAFIRHFG